MLYNRWCLYMCSTGQCLHMLCDMGQCAFHMTGSVCVCLVAWAHTDGHTTTFLAIASTAGEQERCHVLGL